MKKLMIGAACAVLAGAGSAAERVVTAYADNVCVERGAADKPVFIVNATGHAGVLVSLAAAPKAVRAFDVLGREVPVAVPPAGLSRVEVPAGGHLEIVWQGLAK